MNNRRALDNLSMRLFVGIPLGASTMDELLAVTSRLRSSGDGLRWTTPESWHITLQFLGNVTQEQAECVVAGLHKLQRPPLSIWLEQLGCFDRTGVFFAGVGVSPELLLLQEQVLATTAHCGIASESRPYQPHITLARSKVRGHREGLSGLRSKISRQPKFPGFVAEEFLLYESFLGAAGSRYEIRARFPLTQAQASG